MNLALLHASAYVRFMHRPVIGLYSSNCSPVHLPDRSDTASDIVGDSRTAVAEGNKSVATAARL